MSQTEVESRVAALEKEISLLKAKLETKADKTEKNGKRPWWMDHVGIFTDDPAHEEAMRLGREWRESERGEFDKD